MERQAGLGRSLEDVLDSLTPIEPADSAPRHILFGLGPDDASATKPDKKHKSGKKSGKQDQKKKKKKKKSKSKKESKK